MNDLLILLAPAFGVLVGLLAAATMSYVYPGSGHTPRSIRQLRRMLQLDMATATLLIVIGLIWRMLDASELAKSEAEGALYIGVLALGLIGIMFPLSRFSKLVRFRRLVPGWLKWVPVATGFLFIVLALRSWLPGGNPRMAFREITSGTTLLLTFLPLLIFLRRPAKGWQKLSRTNGKLVS